MSDFGGRLARRHVATPEAMNDAQREFLEDIIRERRDVLYQLRDPDGRLNGPFPILLQVPDVGRAVLAVNSAVHRSGLLTSREVEVAILTVASTLKSEFEWYAHALIARAQGIELRELAAFERGDYKPVSQREVAITSIAGAMLEGRPVEDDLFAGWVGDLGSPTVAVVITLVGSYRTVADLLRVYEIPSPT